MQTRLISRIIAGVFSMKFSDRQTVEGFLDILIELETKKIENAIDEILSLGIVFVVKKFIKNKHLLLKVLEFLSFDTIYYGNNINYLKYEILKRYT